MPIYQITSFRGGLSDYEDKGISGSFKFSSNLDIRKDIDSISCQQDLVEESHGTIVDLIKYFVKSNDGNTYGFGDTGRIYKRTSDGTWNIIYTDGNGEIKGAAEWYADSGETYLFWATDTVIKKKEIPGLSNWSDVSTVGSNLTSADSHDMREAGGALVIANGTALAMVGYDQSYTNNALDLIPGSIAKTVVERNGRSIIGTANSGDPTRGVNGAIDTEVPLAQIGNEGEIFFADMNSSMSTTLFPGGGIVNPGGVANEIASVSFFEWEQTALSWIDKQTVGNMAMFAVYNADSGTGGIYKYGRRKKNHPFVLNLDHLLDADELGAIVNTAGTTLVSYKSGSDYQVKAVDSTAKATGTYEGLDFKSPIKRPIGVTSWMVAKLFCSPLPAGCSIEFWYKLDKTGSFKQAYMERDVTSFTATGEKEAVFNIAEKAEIFEPKVVLNPSGNNTPEVHKIEIFFK